MKNDETQQLKSELESFDHAMLATRRGSSELRSRPMQVAGIDERCHIWFISSISSGKLEEMTEFPSVNVSFQDGQRFASVSGVVRVTRDREALDKYWTTSQAVWFEQGRQDPELVLIEVVPTYAEFWDRSGSGGLKFLLLEAQALMSGDKPEDDPSLHEKIRFQ